MPTVTLTAGGRLFKYDNRLIGFFGFGRNPARRLHGPAVQRQPAARKTGVAGCFIANGETLVQAFDNGEDIDAIGFAAGGRARAARAPTSACSSNGKVMPKRAKGNGFTHRLTRNGSRRRI